MQVATPAEIYEQPNSRWVAEFIGDVNLIEGGLAAVERAAVVIESAAGRLVAAHRGRRQARHARSGSRCGPEKVGIVGRAPGRGGDNCVSGQVVDIGYLGDVSVYHVRLAPAR